MFEVQDEVMQQLANYLAKKPYYEVAGLINALNQCKKQPEKETEDVGNDED